MSVPAKRAKVADSMEVDEPLSEKNPPNDDEIDHISDDEEGGMRIGDIYIPPAPKPALTMETTGPRLIITHIVNENFKSYAGVEVLGPFHKSFSAIIGPNGSGKSNVIDSMLFVFGYRAAKIRSKKISVLLHSSSKFPNVNSASVAVHFALIIDGEGDDYTVVPKSEIVVTRTAFKDNSSYYTLNGKRVQFKEVAKMLRSHSIDLDHNRFLILQGEVEQIAMMKPKGQTEHDTGMLEYLEDIIGTSRYKEPIEKLNMKVEELTEARKDKLNRVRLVESEKQRLEGPMKEAVAAVNISNSIVKARNTLLQKYIHETNKMIADKNKDLDKLKDDLQKIDNKVTEIREKLKEKQSILDEGNKKYSELHKKKDSLSEHLQNNKKKTVTVLSDITQGNKKKKNLDELLKNEKNKLMDLEQTPEKNKKEIEECEHLLKKLNKERAEMEEELQTIMATVRTKTQGLQEKKDGLQTKLIDLKKDVDEKTNTFKLAESELKIYLSNETSEQKKFDNLKQSLENAVSSLDAKENEIKELKSVVPKAQDELNICKSELEKLKKEETETVKETRSLRSQVEESKAAMTANRSRGRVLDSLMKEKRNGNLPGIFGRLGDLGAIDSKYDVAISTCCGALDNIVCDTIDTAQQCVDYLRKNNIGRATFIALDKQQHLEETSRQKITTPENVPRLFDLVKVKDERVLPAFYYALRDTLVAKELDQATRIAYGRTRYRVVTLGGDVIEIAGTMSGGGKSVSRGRMSSSVQQDTSIDQRDIAEKELRLSTLQDKLTTVRKEQTTLEDKASHLSQTATQGKMQMNKLQMEIESLKEQIPLLKSQLKQQEKRVESSKVDSKQKAVFEKKISSAKNQLELAKEKAGEIEEKVAQVDKEIGTVAGGKVKELQKAVNNLTTRIDKVKSEITKLKVAINTSTRNAKKSAEKITQMESDLQETTKKLELLNEEKKKLTIETAEFQKELEEIEEQISEGGSEFKGLKDEIAKIQGKENKMKSERLEIANEKQKLDKTIDDFKSKLPIWQKELKTLRLEDVTVDGIPGVESPAPLVEHSSEELDNFTVDDLRQKLQGHKNRMGDQRPNMQAIQEYKAKEEMYLKRVAELDEITNKRNEMRSLYEQLRKKRTSDFLAGFNTITAKLKEMYQMITLGGDAELELVDSLDPFTEGIVFSVRPPNKSWKNISNLSGGEKTLSSLALVFALHYYRPTPLYVMDEIDAALDFKNVSIVGNYIKERTKNAQFIIISLRYNMFEMSNRLLGIYKQKDCTSSITIDNDPSLLKEIKI